MLFAGVDWTAITVAAIAAVPATVAAVGALVVGLVNRRNLRTPSGDRIGHVVERTHDLAAAATLQANRIEEAVGNGNGNGHDDEAAA